MRFSVWTFLTVFTVLVGELRSQLVGQVPTCENEGEILDLEIVAGDPCITCRCKGGQVDCNKEQCPNLDQCKLIIDTLSPSCCKYCKGCTYDGEKIESGRSWISEFDPCLSIQCQEGVITSSRIQCHSTCSHPVSEPGQCCPSCQDCLVHNNIYKDGDVFSLPEDPCVTCTCQGGSVRCEKKACPVLSCPERQIVLEPGQCCPDCTVQRRVFDLADSRCLFANEVYNDGKTFMYDECTSCNCLDSTVVCSREVCPLEFDCSQDDIVHEEGECCPKCQEKVCRVDGREYQDGETWKREKCIACICQNREVICTTEQCSNDLECPRDYSLKKEEGECCPKCVEDTGTCTVFGDPHYKTFDGRLYNFQGSCKYILTRDCRDKTFTVRVKNDVRESRTFAWTKSVFISFEDFEISLMQDLAVRVNKEDISLPYSPTTGLSIYKSGYMVSVKTSFGLQITWDGESYLEVAVPASFKNKLCGLCGNYNDVMHDDYTTRDGAVKSHVEIFANSWRVGRKSLCTNPPRKGRIKSMCKSDEIKSRSRSQCKVLKSKDFWPCNELVPVESYYKSCVSDMCECPKQDCLCESFTAYIRECGRKGVQINWSPSPGQCREFPCPEGSVFNPCGTACPRTCENRNDVLTCAKPCIPGCQCPVGTVLHMDKCVPPSVCPV